MDINHIRGDFPMLTKNPNLIYFDNAATTLKPQCVLDKLNEYYTHFGVSIRRGTYNLSVKAENMFEDTREKVADFINSDAREVIFTSNASYALNMAALMCEDLINEGDHILTSKLEHHSAFLPFQSMEKKKHCVLDYVALDSLGRLDLDDFENKIKNHVKIVTINLVSNTMGCLIDIKKICCLAHKFGAIVMVDITQGISFYNIDVKDLDCDFAFFSAHKLLGPTGVGIMYAKYNLLEKMSPIFYGGDMIKSVTEHNITLSPIPYRYEVGTPNIAGVIAFGAAINYINKIGKDNIHQYEFELRDYLIKELSKVKGVTIYNATSDTAIINFNINGVPAHDASTFYDSYGICLRAGQHCAALVADFLKVNATLRVSLYFYNSTFEIDKFIQATESIIEFFSEGKQ